MADGETTATSGDTATTTATGGDAGESEAAKTAEQTGGQETDFKAESRKHERRAKESHQLVQELEAKLARFEESSKSETEKALDKARKEAKAEAEQGFEGERRADRLQVAVSRHARDLADVDDVILNLEREGINDYFDKDGKVDPEALKKGIDDLLSRKSHLKAGPHGRPSGDVDAGKGSGGSEQTMNDLMRSAR